MFENNTDRMFWTIAVLILGATLLMIGNRAFPKAQESIMSTISQNITTSNNATNKLTASANPDSDEAKKENFQELKNYSYDYNNDGSINLTYYNGDKKNIDIPKWGPAQNSSDIKDAVKITSLNKNNNIAGTFGDKHITSASIPDSVNYLGRSAFYKCDLTNIDIPQNVTYIGFGAFANNNLKSVKIPTSLTTLDVYAFEYNQLETATIPRSVKNINMDAFTHNNLKSIDLFISTNNVDSGAFDANVKINKYK